MVKTTVFAQNKLPGSTGEPLLLNKSMPGGKGADRGPQHRQLSKVDDHVEFVQEQDGTDVAHVTLVRVSIFSAGGQSSPSGVQAI